VALGCGHCLGGRRPVESDETGGVHDTGDASSRASSAAAMGCGRCCRDTTRASSWAGSRAQCLEGLAAADGCSSALECGARATEDPSTRPLMSDRRTTAPSATQPVVASLHSGAPARTRESRSRQNRTGIWPVSGTGRREITRDWRCRIHWLHALRVEIHVPWRCAARPSPATTSRLLSGALASPAAAFATVARFGAIRARRHVSRDRLAHAVPPLYNLRRSGTGDRTRATTWLQRSRAATLLSTSDSGSESTDLS